MPSDAAAERPGGTAVGALDGIFLDLYGTITSGDRAAVHTACQCVVDDHRLPLSAGELAVRWGERFFELIDESNHDGFRTLAECEYESLVQTARELRVELDPRPYVRILEEYWRNPPLHAEVRAAVAALRLPVCIVSNADTDAARAALARHGLRFAALVTSQETRSYKPDAAIFEAALRRTGWHRERVLHVGDSLHSDVRGARQAGIRSAWVCRDERIHDIGRLSPDYTVRDLNELVRLLAGTVSGDATDG